ncbi:hypothetical protein FDENT_13954 [Fusarium denticulatum]|uniref:Uncharacterized protein n=1 Tax=Fusarium denticulatum TaxID=48507 RepID=A0A8H5WI33_9HYPO|nr:hypothetical protein FDENT_13954 [Fusarium denticulatum]
MFSTVNNIDMRYSGEPKDVLAAIMLYPNTGSAEGSVDASTKKTTEKSTAKEKMLSSEVGYLSGNEGYHDNNSEKRGDYHLPICTFISPRRLPMAPTNDVEAEKGLKPESPVKSAKPGWLS